MTKCRWCGVSVYRDWNNTWVDDSDTDACSVNTKGHVPEPGEVYCDEGCEAQEYPDLDDLEQVRKTMIHYRDHGYLSGCSHGN